MLKPLTLSLSLAVALGFCSVSMAGGHDGCTNCGLASPQGGPIASAQGPIATGCDVGDCGGRKCHLFSGLGGHLDGLHCKLKGLLHPPVTYEWVLKKKRLWGHHGCGGGGCETCGGAAPVYPTGQVAPSGQGGWAAPSGQGGGYAAPQAAPTYGAGQHAYRPARTTPTIASVPAEMTPAIAGEEVPPAPEVKQSSSSGLLLPTPAGN
jgi:hypothetical protein